MRQAATLAAMARVYAALNEDEKATEAAVRGLAITDELERLTPLSGVLLRIGLGLAGAFERAA